MARKFTYTLITFLYTYETILPSEDWEFFIEFLNKKYNKNYDLYKSLVNINIKDDVQLYLNELPNIEEYIKENFNEKDESCGSDI